MLPKMTKVKATRSDVPSTKNGRGSLTRSGFERSLSENTEVVKQKCSVSFTEKETDAAITVNPSPGVGRNTASVSYDSISENEEFGNR